MWSRVKSWSFAPKPGEYTYDTSTEPSIFSGSLGKSILDTFKLIGKRFTYGGDTGKDQRVYYFNLKELVDNKFGTANPIPFRVVDNNIGLDLDTAVRCNGIYSYKITNPLLFYTHVCGNVEEDYERSELDSQLKTEFISALQPAFAKLSQLGMRPNAIPGHAEELCNAMNEALSAKWSELRGISVVSIAMNPITLPEEDAELIKELQKDATMRDPRMAAAQLTSAQADAMRKAAANESGAITGFMGMGMAGGMGNNIQSLFQMGGQEPTPTTPAPSGNTWNCDCGTENTGNFCMNCGSPKPQTDWTCSCGAVNKGKFCTNCGKPKPAAEAHYRCSNCGWEPEDSNESAEILPAVWRPI